MNIQTKLTLLLLSLAMIIILAVGIFATISMDTYVESRITDELKIQAAVFETIIQTFKSNDAVSYAGLQKLARSANIRLTLITDKGIVIFESELAQSQLPRVQNHLNRPEVQEALMHVTGMYTRHSSTINIEMLYLAKKIANPFPASSGYSDTAILRVGIPLTQINEVITGIRTKIIIVSSIVFAAVVAISLVVSKRIARPIHEMAIIAEQIRSGDLDQRIPVRSKDEFGKLAESLNSMVNKLNDDITAMKKLERVRSEFLGNVSHEVRTPIFAMQGMLETLLQGALDDKEISRDFIERTLTNTRRLNALLGDLIDISRIESGDMKMSFRYFPLNDFLEYVIEEALPMAQQKNISITMQKLQRKIEVLGDRDRLKQVMVNLIDNGVKYTESGGCITIAGTPENGQVRISVSDSGIGIDGEHLPRIFERFYRIDKERSRDAGGTGLGLAIVKHIIEAHDSKVDVQSEVGKGSTFSFMLKKA